MNPRNKVFPVGERIRKARLEAGLTEEDLGRAVHRSWRTIRRYEYGECLPPLDIAYDIAVELGVCLDWLMGRPGEHMPKKWR